MNERDLPQAELYDNLQIINLSGAAGDLIVTIKFSGFPKDILIRDYGVGMTVFSKE